MKEAGEPSEAMVRASRAPADTPVVSIRGLCKQFGVVRAIEALDLDVMPGELLALLGPSGCGKTTTLRLLAGFERPDSGTVYLDGEVVSSDEVFVAPERRNMGVVFQDFALFPHLTVAQNLGYGVRNRALRAKRVAEMLDLIGLSDAKDRRPFELSGGQQQRVALGRALAPDPALVLLDEPFSNLDATLRVRMRADVREILNAAGATAVLVTHDQEEALTLADRVAVMNDGHLIQVDVPAELYAHPLDPFVATFVGDADLLPGVSNGTEVETVIGRLRAPGSPGGQVDVIVRPEQVKLWLDGNGIGVVLGIEYFGHDQLVEVGLPDGSRARARLGSARDVVPGDRVSLAVTGATLAFLAPQRSS